MGRRRRVRDDLIDIALDTLRTAGDAARDRGRDNPTSPEAIARVKEMAEREAARERWREERRAKQRADSTRSTVALGAALAVGGVTAAMGLFTVAAVGLGFVTYGVVAFTLRKLSEGGRQAQLPKPAPRPEIAAPRVDEKGMNDARAQLVRKVLDEATVELKKLDAAANAIREPETQAIAHRLVAAGQRLSQGVATAPETLGLAQRAFTYHLPKAAYLAEAYVGLEAAGADEKRRAQARHVLARIENLFEKIALDISAVDAREMDVELRLINEALDEDLNESRAARR